MRHVIPARVGESLTLCRSGKKRRGGVLQRELLKGTIRNDLLVDVASFGLVGKVRFAKIGQLHHFADIHPPRAVLI